MTPADAQPWSAAAAPIWALVCHFPSERRRRRPLVILKGYIDESADQEVFVLAGFVAPAEEWAKFSVAWDAALRMSPRIQFLKTNDAMTFDGEFAGMSEQSRDEKLRLLYSVIDDHVSFSTSAVVLLQPLKKIFSGGLFHKTAAEPYYHALSYLISGVARHQIKIGMEEKIDFVFDERKIEQDKILSIWGRVVDEAPDDVKPMLGGTPTFVQDTGPRGAIALQAADLEAWWLRRRWDEKLKGLPRLEYPWVPADIGEIAGILDEEKLKEIHQAMLKKLWEIMAYRGPVSGRFGPG